MTQPAAPPARLDAQRVARLDGTYEPSEASPASRQRRADWRQLEQGWGIGIELLAAILLGAGVGWLVDRALGTQPWVFAGGALLGYGIGLYLVWLHSGRGQADGLTGGAAREA